MGKSDSSEPIVAQPGKSDGFRFPQGLLNPIGHFLSDQIKKLEFRKKALEKEDPFHSTARLSDNAARPEP